MIIGKMMFLLDFLVDRHICVLLQIAMGIELYINILFFGVLRLSLLLQELHEFLLFFFFFA
jgi:hypothetical protein